jgi:16S rRNA (cytidine1402-2'-O)-methyltransferase
MNRNISLYLVPTPVGNMEDITLRAIRVLKEVDMVLSEDTRTTGNLLKHHGIETRLVAYHAFNEHKTVQGIVSRLKEGAVAALVSDAGTPGISDPGFLLVRACIEGGLEVETLPGATALIPALVNSGLPCDSFYFGGFLPHKKGRQTRLKELASVTDTIVLYESPHRLVKSLEQLAEVFGPDRKASVSRELTKIYEENARGTLAELIVHFSAKQVKGEIVIVIGAP